MVSDLRKSTRKALNASGILSTDGAQYKITTIDVSKGGVSIEIAKQLTVRRNCHVQFDMGSGSESHTVAASCHVIYCFLGGDGKYRAGLQFLAVHAEGESVIDDYTGNSRQNAALTEMANISMETPDTICKFWFGAQSDDTATAKDRARLWWGKDVEADKLIRQRFEASMARAANGEFDSWADTPSGMLALILLSDQFPRNVFRDTPTAFAFDALARRRCKEGLEKGFHLQLRPVERVFFYLPLEHSESLEDQEQSLALFQELSAGVDAVHRSTFEGFLHFAVRHWEIVKQFNRFPHRNYVLGRQSTPEELAFLTQKGSSF